MSENRQIAISYLGSAVVVFSASQPTTILSALAGFAAWIAIRLYLDAAFPNKP